MAFRTALITGASSGLGRGLALHYAKAGTTVWAAARRTGELASLRDEAKAAGGTVIPLVLDVADADATHQTLASLDAEAKLELVVANAGIGEPSNGKKLEWAKVQKVLQVNVLGAAATVTAVLPGMVARGHGHVVGIASLASYSGLPASGAYCGSKAFLRVFLESLRLDLQGTGVTVGCVSPGFVKSELTAKNDFKMPFLMETEVAVKKMARAIDARAPELTFPWQTSLAVKTLAALPRPLFDGVAKRLR